MTQQHRGMPYLAGEVFNVLRSVQSAIDDESFRCDVKGWLTSRRRIYECCATAVAEKKRRLIKKKREEKSFAHSKRSKALFNLSLSLFRGKCLRPVCCDFLILEAYVFVCKRAEKWIKQTENAKKIIYRELKTLWNDKKPPSAPSLCVCVFNKGKNQLNLFRGSTKPFSSLPKPVFPFLGTLSSLIYLPRTF